ncbi:MAG: copper homeostasis periplasmic binding protein CopC [Pseudomonadota bacterium]
MSLASWRSTFPAALLAFACAGQAMAHAVIKTSVPAQGAVLAAAPKEVTISFNEKVEAMFTSASVKNAAGATVSTHKAAIDPADPTMLRLPLPALSAGQYTVKWHAVGSDGHRRNGEIRFSVK